MPFLLLLVTLILQLPAKAERSVVSRIYDIDYGNKSGEDVLVLLENGLVAKYHAQDRAILGKGLGDLKNKTVQIKMNSQRFITDLQETHENQDPSFLFNGLPPKLEESDYQPTTLRSYTLASRYFRSSRYNSKHSQCFNRAMVWTYDWWRKYKVKSSKLFLFFSRAYIRNYNFDWWFHVAPLVQVKINGKISKRVMDRKYASGPLPIRNWTNIFMRNNAYCKPIQKYSDYADFPYTGSCYVQESHMYTYQPADLQMYEAWGYSKDHFEMGEVSGAFLEAFNLRIRGN